MEDLEKEQAEIDRKIHDFSVEQLRPFYIKRRPVLQTVPRFWPTVLCETEPLRPYILFEDSLAFDELLDLYVDFDLKDSRNFTLVLSFNDNPHFEKQTIEKQFLWDEKGYYTSPNEVNIKYKKSINLGNQHQHGSEESFFTLFAYTSTDVEEDRQENTTILQLLVDEIYPNAIDLYKSAQDEDIAEEYDLSDF